MPSSTCKKDFIHRDAEKLLHTIKNRIQDLLKYKSMETSSLSAEFSILAYDKQKYEQTLMYFMSFLQSVEEIDYTNISIQDNYWLFSIIDEMQKINFENIKNKFEEPSAKFFIPYHSLFSEIKQEFDLVSKDFNDTKIKITQKHFDKSCLSYLLLQYLWFKSSFFYPELWFVCQGFKVTDTVYHLLLHTEFNKWNKNRMLLEQYKDIDLLNSIGDYKILTTNQLQSLLQGLQTIESKINLTDFDFNNLQLLKLQLINCVEARVFLIWNFPL